MAVKVDTLKLDSLVDMAGEMVIAQSLVRHDPDLAALKSPRLLRNMAQLTHMTAELQKTAMAMRLVPIGPLFRRMARMVRDLSRQFGKPVEMETQGDEIELDRNIVQELTDPLMHMVRNSLDHGIESPAERERAGKNPVARVLLKGRHQAGQVVIEIADDGHGLDRDKIVEKAIQKGLIESGDGISDNEAYNLIFQPGFSTAAQVTNVSGRGVGMDVVRRHIEKLRGRVEIRSVKGQGATFALKLPLTLAIIDGLVVGVGEERYIAPLFAVREVLRPSAETMWTVQGRAEMALIRGELLPVLRLYRKFRVTPRSEDPPGIGAAGGGSGGAAVRAAGGRVDRQAGSGDQGVGRDVQRGDGHRRGAILGDGRVGSYRRDASIPVAFRPAGGGIRPGIRRSRAEAGRDGLPGFREGLYRYRSSSVYFIKRASLLARCSHDANKPPPGGGAEVIAVSARQDGSSGERDGRSTHVDDVDRLRDLCLHEQV